MVAEDSLHPALEESCGCVGGHYNVRVLQTDSFS